ncbi:uncharacterized protein A1O9_01482 [Exophiala aquamarina CBS 119918]|uniref:peptidylprolyl isomerase n=1 Tax=Exophiala aquamarina CBS 119918 TaxID=1182545 RepID=A0A072PTS3_9EURO|nr:uncharacterized protein A1O9_01482 [Exophiala aquamarina CBS 119918]KEF63504.1 hypothetical protein A1O9_01482 [Exophiala aquamarina CBS 119918]
MDLTLGDAKLADLAIKGVLTLYVVPRQSSVEDKNLQGKDGMFTAASHWELPSQTQSPRAMAAVLASLRVFAHIIGSEEYDDVRQNEILRVVHLLTRFPPTVRAVHILMDGKTLQANESAALVQSLGAVAEELIPMALISNDMTRCLEGARLVLGLILHRAEVHLAKQIGAADGRLTNPKLPYITAYRTIDLRDIKTMEPITEPALTNLGLVNKSVFNAFSSSDILRDSPACYLTRCDDSDEQRLRVSLLYGGATLEASFYEANALGEAFHQGASSDNLSVALDLKSYSMDIQYLASMCGETKLVVVAPRQLSGATTPSLTLDRYGKMAVYTGRAACAAPGQDHSVFHPLTGDDETVDVNIIAQNLEPIIKARELDGTNVFDLFSPAFRRKDAALPTELIVFCVDCSYSMKSSSDFAELNDDDSAPGPSESSEKPDLDLVLEDEDDSSVTLDEVKTWLKSHESYEDILEIVYFDRGFNKLQAAKEVITFLRTLTGRHLTHLAQKQKSVSRWATYTYSRKASTQELSRTRRVFTGLSIHEESLAHFLAFTVGSPDFAAKDFSWNYGDPIPQTAKKVPGSAVDLGQFYIIPEEYLCSISQHVFEDPVRTVDGFTFDRKAIERWYRIRKTSPLTGLAIQDTTLRHNELLANQIKAWVKADDVIQSLPSTPKRTRLGIRQTKAVIEFVAPGVRFAREVPATASLLDLHKIAFRGMRGMYADFALYMGSVRLICCEENIAAKGVMGNQTITIVPNHDPQDITSANAAVDDMCLVQVYASHSPAVLRFNYWIPTHSQLTIGSILFRQWRYDQKTRYRGSKLDKTVWSDLKDGGDGICFGSTHTHWSSLSKVAAELPRVRIREDEPLYERLKDLATKKDTDSLMDLLEASNEDPASSDQYGRHRVLKIRLYDYVDPKSSDKAKATKQKILSRMSVTKQVFSAFINRLIAYNFPTNVGLVTFGTTARVSQDVTDVIENFRQAVEKMEPEGDTALWDALGLAADHLVDVAKRYPSIKKRVICLSDGEDTSSIKAVGDVVRMLMRHDIVVDSVCIGDEDNSALRTVSYCTGGYRFVPNTIEEASVLCELEPVLSIYERPIVSRQSLFFLTNFSQLSYRAKPNPVTRDEFPARRTHDNLRDTFVQIGQFERIATQQLSQSSIAATTSIRSRRLLLEIRDIAAHPHPSYDVYVSETNIGFWKVVLEGPNHSAYASGVFVMYLAMEDEYPRRPPQGRFVTPVFHPNVNRHGRICHSIFDRNWTVDTTNKQILDTVFGLLLVPEFSDPINTVVTLNYYWDEVAFKDEVQKHICKYANKSRRVLGAEILGEGSSNSENATTNSRDSGGAPAPRGNQDTNARESFGTG